MANRRDILLAKTMLRQSLLIESMMDWASIVMTDKKRDGTALSLDDAPQTGLTAKAPTTIDQLKDELTITHNTIQTASDEFAALYAKTKYHQTMDIGLGVFTSTKTNLNYVCATKPARITSDNLSIAAATDKSELEAVSYTFEYETQLNDLYSVHCEYPESIHYRAIRQGTIINDLIDVAGFSLRDTKLTIKNRKEIVVMRMGQCADTEGIFNDIKSGANVSLFGCDMGELESDISDMAAVAIEANKDIALSSTEQDLIDIADYLVGNVPLLVMMRRYPE